MGQTESESRGRMEARLAREGRLDAFNSRWRGLRAEGTDGSAAYRLAVKEFSVPLQSAEGVGSEVAELVPKGTFEGKRAPSRKAVEWVASHLETAGLEPGDAPSGESWSLLCWARGDSESRRDFWKAVYPRILPTKGQLEAEDAAKGDDGRDLRDLISRVRKEHEDKE